MQSSSDSAGIRLSLFGTVGGLTSRQKIKPGRCILLLFLYQLISLSCAFAEYSGVALILSESESDWQFEGRQRTAKVSQIGLQVEDKTRSGLAIGAGIGRFGVLVSHKQSPYNTEKFDASYIGLHLRQPLRINQSLSFQGILSYRYNTTSDKDEADGGIDWGEAHLRAELLLRYQAFRGVAFTSVRHVSGDITRITETEVFDAVERVSSGLSLDYFVEPSAYIRVEFSTGDVEGATLSFVRDY